MRADDTSLALGAGTLFVVAILPALAGGMMNTGRNELRWAKVILEDTMHTNDSEFNVARIGAVAGWLALAGILAFSVFGPMVVAGQRVSGTLDPAVIAAYYRHAALAPVSAAAFSIIVFFLPFALALRQVLSLDARARFLSTLGLAFAVAAVPLYLSDASLQAALVGAAAAGSDVVPLFRFWDIQYNSASYVLEAGYVAAFSMAMRAAPSFPRWMPRYGLIVAASLLVNATALFVGIHDNLTLIGNLALVGWFIGTNVGLSRVARHAGAMDRTATTAALA
jgi:hypothetical protein